MAEYWSLEPARARPGAARSALAAAAKALLLVGLAVTGLAFGRLVDHVTHGASVNGIAAANATAPYGLIIAVISVLPTGAGRAAVNAATFFSAFVVGYYCTLAWQHGVGSVDRHYAAVWLLLAVAACPLVAALVSWARRRSGVLRAVVFAVPAGAAGTEILTDRTWGMASAISPVVVALDAALVLVYLIVLPRGLTTRAAAIVWCAPVVAVLLAVTTVLADDDAYFRWMY
jgi:hypothetical protein